MNRAFGFPLGGFGHFGHFHPFFPRRRFFPFFFLSPFFFPFWRGENDQDDTYFSRHECRDGDTLSMLAEQYNVPRPILETMNPHIQNAEYLPPGSTAYIPRLDKMYCHKMYLEHETPTAGGFPPSFEQQMMPPYPGMTQQTMYPPQPTYYNQYSMHNPQQG